ncbi:hypothetical protein HPB50_005364 [Hyalomma asiaticum]|uniref:Uncharacterized protein n=1 Tax=Hyalomma asiaticum TaxID=266040 RepID=A0ACB7TFA4_HYAAI|nr:hypothetical protein HPB50_005364 [Hyalomma asiaticum]
MAGKGWESQLLETGFLAIFFCPIWTWKQLPRDTPPSPVVVWGYRWLLFRIMLGAICCEIQRIGTTTAVGSKERRHEPYDRQRVLRHMSAADSAQRSDVPQQATNVLKPATLVLNAAAHGSAPSANMDDAGKSEAKKLRVDKDKRSTYDLSEDEDINCDETPIRPEDHNHSECKSVHQPKCANCGGNQAASYSGCPQNIAASKLRRHELIYGRLPPHNVPSPNPDTVRYMPSISNQEQEQTDKHSYSATLKRPGHQGPSTERHDQSTGNAAYCAEPSRESGRAAQQQPVPLSQQPHLTSYQRRQHSPPRHQSSQRPHQAALRQPAPTVPGASASTSDYAPVPMAHMLLPMLFTALRAILSAIPQANNVPETQPVPNPLSFYLHQTPEFVHKLEVIGNHIIELIVPWFMFLTRPFRIACGIIQISFQVILIMSGNLSFLNWLTILPSIPYFDDAMLKWMFSKKTSKQVALLAKETAEGKVKHRLQPPPPFLPSPGHPAVPWDQWKQAFQTYMVASGASDLPTERRKAILLTCLGMEGQRIFSTLTPADLQSGCATATVASPSSTSDTKSTSDAYDSATALFSDHFKCSVNVIVA